MDRPNMEVNTSCLTCALLLAWFGLTFWSFLVILAGIILPIFYPNKPTEK